ncbi:hypothetical protein [Halorubrum sp. GN11_10-6_MGM]|uniref:hypothetical protein n=1 Tax=Halorubrum sp. GN11_10-6_MGM TaxID=2518112 RepID=UPI001F5434B3|nr:hypothetical protein [Halorubrum sp. GN11_10-6_MGM]
MNYHGSCATVGVVSVADLTLALLPLSPLVGMIAAVAALVGCQMPPTLIAVAAQPVGGAIRV